MAFERLKFPPPWMAGPLIVGISLLLFMTAYPLYIDIPIKIILGYVAYPFVFRLFKDKISSFLTNKEFSTLKEPEQSLISLTTYQLQGKGIKEPLRAIFPIIIFWGIGEVVSGVFSVFCFIILWVVLLFALFIKQII
jgi:hypothetical protein